MSVITYGGFGNSWWVWYRYSYNGTHAVVTRGEYGNLVNLVLMYRTGTVRYNYNGTHCRCTGNSILSVVTHGEYGNSVIVPVTRGECDTGVP